MELVYLLVFMGFWVHSEAFRTPVIGNNMNLGYGVDVEKYDYAGYRLFTQSAIEDNTVEIAHPTVDIRYKVVRSKKDLDDILNVGGSLSLKLQTSIKLDVAATGSYLKEKKSAEEFIQVIAVVDVINKTETLTAESELRSDFSQQINKATHYVRSVTYGARLIGSIKVIAKSVNEKEDINVKASVDLSLSGGALDIGVKGQFRKLEQEFGGSNDVRLKITSTDAEGKVMTDMNSFLSEIEKFPAKCSTNRALYVDLVPLNTLPGYNPTVQKLKDNQMEMLLKRAGEEYSDVSGTLAEITKLNKALRGSANTEERRETIIKLRSLEKRARSATEEYATAIDSLRVGEYLENTKRVSKAKKVYVTNSKVGGIPGSYMAEFKDIRGTYYKVKVYPNRPTFYYTVKERMQEVAVDLIKAKSEEGKYMAKLYEAGQTLGTSGDVAKALSLLKTNSESVLSMARFVEKERVDGQQNMRTVHFLKHTGGKSIRNTAGHKLFIYKCQGNSNVNVDDKMNYYKISYKNYSGKRSEDEQIFSPSGTHSLSCAIGMQNYLFVKP